MTQNLESPSFLWQFYNDLTGKRNFLKWYAWFKFNNLGLVLVNPIQDGLFRGCSRIGGGGTGAKRPPLSKICHTYPTVMKLGTLILYLNKIQKYINNVTHPLSSADISIFFIGNQQILLNQEIQI